ncbi:MAG: polysaccharide biosynthesis protein [Gammaproteobacteria bacterium]|nr:polysaccharide biosynthesis protein [Gammaproteobacteria bacterium]
MLEHLLATETANVTGVDHNQEALFYLDRELGDRVNLQLGDVADAAACDRLLAGIDVVIHTAAYKHVGLCEASPAAARRNNVTALEHLLAAAQRHGIKRFVYTSSDKAVEPANVMGRTKQEGERLVSLAGEAGQGVYTTIRFGNVLGSSGSVIPLVMRQLQRGEPVTLTDGGMRRFFITALDVAKRIVTVTERAQGGEIFVVPSPVIRIRDLIEVMAAQLGDAPAVTISGVRPGEKLAECLLAAAEAQGAVMVDDFVVVNGPGRSDWTGAPVSGAINAKDAVPLNRDAIAALLQSASLLPPAKDL